MTASLDQVRTAITELLPRLRRFARTITRTRDEADDLVHASIARALHRDEVWRAESRMESWLFGIMHRAWIDEVGTRQSSAGEIASAEYGHASQGETLSIQTALAALPDEQRTAVALVLIEGLSYREAAEALEVPLDALTTRLARGRETLQALL